MEKPKPDKIVVVAGVIAGNGKILICQRRASDSHALKWEFPGGKVRPGETLMEGLQRELREELGIEAEIGPELYRTVYQYEGGPELLLVFYLVTGYRGQIENRAFADVRWVGLNELSRFDFLAGDVEFVKLLERGAFDLELEAGQNSGTESLA